ncbi:MAG TPA: hypothetical protein VKM55_17640 [Candidatus Lokiarchaeia archaeon]|nr:hypothetical protein [Candidatus Lokiarchaeia archaeon]
MTPTIKIEKRFCGPRDSGQGGYVCGMLGGFIKGTAEVTLRMPPPLDQELDVEVGADNVRLLSGDALVAEARPTEFSLDVPGPPTYDEAILASRDYIGFTQHAYPTCFVCGPDRAEGDGLRIFPGPVPGKEIVAAPWIPDASFTGDDGLVRPEIVWASLDCPGAFGVLVHGLKLVILGRLAVKIETRPLPEEKYVVVGWHLSTDGRKNYAGTALFSENGELHATGKAVWIDLQKDWA